MTDPREEQIRLPSHLDYSIVRRLDGVEEYEPRVGCLVDGCSWTKDVTWEDVSPAGISWHLQHPEHEPLSPLEQVLYDAVVSLVTSRAEAPGHMWLNDMTTQLVPFLAARVRAYALTEDEQRTIELAGDVASLTGRVIRAPGKAGSAAEVWDTAEMTAAVHTVQRMVGAQAAARLFPELFRPLGATLQP